MDCESIYSHLEGDLEKNAMSLHERCNEVVPRHHTGANQSRAHPSGPCLSLDVVNGDDEEIISKTSTLTITKVTTERGYSTSQMLAPS